MRVHRLAVILGLSLSGCAAVQDFNYSMTNKFRANHAWHSSPEASGDCSRHYSHGWRQGYYDVATGDCGAPPAVPPSKYWSAKYQDLNGQQAIDDWYRGYQCGAAAAEQVGHPHWNSVPAFEAPESAPPLSVEPVMEPVMEAGPPHGDLPYGVPAPEASLPVETDQ